MIVDGLFVVLQIGYSIAILLNMILWLTFLLRPLKMNASKYFIPIMAAQNIIFSVCSMLVVPRAVALNFCWIFAASGVVSDSWEVGQSILVLFFLIFLASILNSTNSFFYLYLQICRSKHFALFSSIRGLIVWASVNCLIILNYAGYVYVGLWPTNDLVPYLAPSLLHLINLDLYHVPFVGSCLKPKVNWFSLALSVDSMLTRLLLATSGIYWAYQVNKKLKESSFSMRTKSMQRQMNNLLVIQTACPALFLHIPAMVQYLMVFAGATTGTVVAYCCGILWMCYPIFSPLITMVFLREYRNFLLKKLGINTSS